MKVLFSVCAGVMLLFVTGCASGPRVWVDSEASISKATTYGVSDLKLEPRDISYIMLTQGNGGEIVKEALENAFRKAGLKVVDNGSADIKIAGKVTSFHRGVEISLLEAVYTEVAFAIKARDAKTGAVVFTASHSKTAGFNYDCEPSIMAEEVAAEVVKSLKKSLNIK